MHIHIFIDIIIDTHTYLSIIDSFIVFGIWKLAIL